MIKRLGVFASVLAAVFAVTVSADLIVHNKNVFLNRNRDKTQKLEREGFIVNSPSGYVILQEEPGKAEKTGMREVWGKWENGPLQKLKNGDVLHIESVYNHNGRYWGVSWSGWVPMDHLLTLYTTDDFERDNKGKFYEYSGNDDVAASIEKIVLWEWPGSDREKRVVENKNKYRDIEDFGGTFRVYTYKDKAGREWGKARIRPFPGWVCLSDPENKSKIPAFNPAPKPAKWSPNDIKEKQRKMPE